MRAMAASQLSINVKNTFIDVCSPDSQQENKKNEAPRQCSAPTESLMRLHDAETRLNHLDHLLDSSSRGEELEPNGIELMNGFESCELQPPSISSSSEIKASENAEHDFVQDCEERSSGQGNDLSSELPSGSTMQNTTIARSLRPLHPAGCVSHATAPNPFIKSRVDPDPRTLGEWYGKTTAMLRNIPYPFTETMLREELALVGFGHSFDYLYLPFITDMQRNKGYAFINFLNSTIAHRFKVMYNFRKLRCNNVERHVWVTPARLQGYFRNMCHYASHTQSDEQDSALVATEYPITETSEPNPIVPMSKDSETTSLVHLAADCRQGCGDIRHSRSRTGEPNRVLASTHKKLLVKRFCQYCGSRVQPSFLFCQICGSSLA
eukprot:TRINITY_DN57504_c0_g1_i1.p1 TRINITY_DN57504_c0_g1~~TRINITY_DN57504_c0_g1_i1.p1  ORF type:complete len:379 (-),score=27.12 TRINITY_DN57504_c0_g1_i1:294-1430(-)